MRFDLRARQGRSGGRPPARVTDQRREIADDEDCVMSEILKLPELRQCDRVAEVDVGRRRIHPQLHAQRSTLAQAGDELFLRRDLDDATPQGGELRLGAHHAFTPRLARGPGGLRSLDPSPRQRRRSPPAR